MGRAIGVALIVVLLIVAGLFAFGGGASFSYDGPEAPPFSISWDDLNEVDPDPGSGALLQLQSDPQNIESLAITPLEFEQGLGDEPLPELALEADRVAERIGEEYDGATIVLQGRTALAVDRGPEAYQLAFVAPAEEGGIVIGKRFLVPDPDRPGEGVEIEIAERTSKPAVIEKVERAPAGFFGNWPVQLLLEDAVSVRTEEALEKPLRSFSFG